METGYEGYPRKVAEYFSIAFDIVISGSKIKQARTSAMPFNSDQNDNSIYFITHLWCEQQLGKGWTVEPIEFRLTGLKFSPIQNPATAAGFSVTGPRKNIKTIFSVNSGNKYQEMKGQQHPVAHFLIDGYWIFKAIKGKEEKYFAIRLNYQANTTHHVPYDQNFAKEFAEFKQKFKDDPKASFGRPLDWDRPIYEEWTVGDQAKAVSQIKQYLKVVPGGDLKDFEMKNIKINVGDLLSLLRKYNDKSENK